MVKVRSKLLSKYKTVVYVLVFVAGVVGLYYLFRNNFITRVGKEGLKNCNKNAAGEFLNADGTRMTDTSECEGDNQLTFEQVDDKDISLQGSN